MDKDCCHLSGERIIVRDEIELTQPGLVESLMHLNGGEAHLEGTTLFYVDGDVWLRIDDLSPDISQHGLSEFSIPPSEHHHQGYGNYAGTEFRIRTKILSAGVRTYLLSVSRDEGNLKKQKAKMFDEGNVLQLFGEGPRIQIDFRNRRVTEIQE